MQLAVRDFIERYSKENARGPTYQEIAMHFGVTKTTAFEHVLGLVKKGMVRKVMASKAKARKGGIECV